MTIYLDIVFLENVILNYIIIFSTAIISKSKINLLKFFYASCIGSIYTIVNYIFNVNFIINFLTKIVISILMIKISYNCKRIKTGFKQLMFFYFISFTFGGISFVLLYSINPENLMYVKNHFIGLYPVKIAIVAGIIGFVGVYIITKIIKNNNLKGTMLYDIEIFNNGKSKKIKSLLDTGNLLKEPVTQKDVIIVEKDSLIDIVDSFILKNIKNILCGKWLEKNNLNKLNNIKVIPYMSLGNENGILLGFKPDYIKIFDEEECIRDDMIVAIYDGKLSKTNLYTSLISLNVLKKGEIKDEFF